MINRKSLVINKPQIFYNDDSLDSYCLPLATNSLKWSESFLGDCMNFDNKCKYEEPLQSIALDIDWPKVCLFERNDGSFYSTPPSQIGKHIIGSSSLTTMSWSNDTLVRRRMKWCLDNVCIDEVPKLEDDAGTTTTTLLRQAWKDGNEDVMWSDVMTREWNTVDNCMMTMSGGQVLSLNGLLGVCHEMAPSEWDRHSLVSRMCANRDVVRSLTIDNMVWHHTNEVILHLTRNVKAIFPIMPLDIEDTLDRSPSMVVHNFIRMWSMMNQSLPGIMLTTPMFSDSATDYKPWKIGPKFFLSPMPMQMHSYTKDPTYRLYSSFIYLPEQF